MIKAENRLETEEYILLGAIAIIILGKIYTEFLLPTYLELKADVLNNLQIIIIVSSLILFVSLFITYKVMRYKQLKRKLREIESRIYWEKMRKEEEKRMKENEYQIPKKRNNEEHLAVPVEPEVIVRKKDINVDLDRNFYRRDELNEDEVEYLLTHQEYSRFESKSLASGKREEFILKPRFNEHLNHLFFTYDIMEFLRKKGLTANTYTTRMPDVVFILKGKSYAVEVETGSVMKNMKKFREKIEQLNLNYKDRWFFVPTNKNLVQKYRKYGKTIDPRCLTGFFKRLLKNHKICPSEKAGGKSVHRRTDLFEISD